MKESKLREIAIRAQLGKKIRYLYSKAVDRIEEERRILQEEEEEREHERVLASIRQAAEETRLKEERMRAEKLRKEEERRKAEEEAAAEALRLQVEARKVEIRKKVGREIQKLYLAADKSVKKRRAEERQHQLNQALTQVLSNMIDTHTSHIAQTCLITESTKHISTVPILISTPETVNFTFQRDAESELVSYEKQDLEDGKTQRRRQRKVEIRQALDRGVK